MSSNVFLAFFNSLSPGNCGFNFYMCKFQMQCLPYFMIISIAIALMCTAQDLIDYESALVWVMACCRQATNNCMNQSLPRSVSPNGVTMPHCVYIVRKEPHDKWLYTVAIALLYDALGEQCIALRGSLFVVSNLRLWQVVHTVGVLHGELPWIPL